MTIKRENPGDIELSVSVYRGGEKLQSSGGQYDLREFVRGFEIYESITSATLEGMLIIEDAAGLIGAFTGSELFKIQVTGTIAYNQRDMNWVIILTLVLEQIKVLTFT